MMEHIKHGLDIASLATAVTTLFGILPNVAALLSVIWTLIRIYETKTVQKWLGK